MQRLFSKCKLFQLDSFLYNQRKQLNLMTYSHIFHFQVYDKKNQVFLQIKIKKPSTQVLLTLN